MIKQNYSVSVADARFAKPIDKEMINDLAINHNNLLVIEEASSGGFSSAVLTYLANQDLKNSNFKVKHLCMPDYFIEHKTQEEQIVEAGLDEKHILEKALSLLERHKIKAIS